MSYTHTQRFSFDPIDQLLPPDTPVAEVARIIGTKRKQIYRWREVGLFAEHADQVAVRLGYHPGELWPEWWNVPPVVDRRERERLRGQRRRAAARQRTP